MDTPELLLHHALRLFSDRGYDGCGVQEICDAAGVTKPTLYHHFGNKAGVLRAVVEEFAGPLTEDLRSVLPYAGDLPATLAGLAGVFFRHAAARPVEFRYYLSLGLAPAGSGSRAAIDPTERWITDQVTAVFAAAAKDHGNMRGRHLLLAAGFLGTVHTFGALIAEGRVALTDDLVHRAVHQFSHGIYS